MDTPKKTGQEKKKEAVQKLIEKLAEYQTQMATLQGKIDDLKKEIEKLEGENKEQVEKDDAEILSMLESALKETEIVDTKFEELFTAVEIKPKSKE